MKKVAIYFFVVYFIIALTGIEKYFLFLTDRISFTLLVIYFLISLFTKDIEIKKVYYYDKEWIWLFFVTILIDIYLLVT